jgi:hypothetical protein
MIPHRMLSNEFGSNGIKDRVTACRKRLRVSRVTNKAFNESCELFAGAESEIEPAPAAYENRELVLLVEDQEVGIT